MLEDTAVKGCKRWPKCSCVRCNHVRETQVCLHTACLAMLLAGGRITIAADKPATCTSARHVCTDLDACLT